MLHLKEACSWGRTWNGRLQTLLPLYPAVGPKQPPMQWETMNLSLTLDKQGHEAEYRFVSGAENM
jgi:hypothetical protein